jgi:NAD(P)-dependent dehydrogenase (short-subunit alcohol dehydrogenase family)
MNCALITGTSKGLGLELARELLARRFLVIGVSRSSSPIGHDNYHHLQADITASDYPATLIDFVTGKDIKHIGIVINNAGVAGTGADIESADAENLRRQFEIHCLAAFSTIQALRPLLDHSKLVNITSRLGSAKFNARGDYTGREFSYGYRIAKSAQNMLSLCMAGDDRLAGNLVISVIPGLLRTDSGAEDASHSASEGAKAVVGKILSIDKSGIYHAFDDEAAF